MLRVSGVPPICPMEVEFSKCYEYDAVCPYDSLHFSSINEWRRHHLLCHYDQKWKCPLCGKNSQSWHNYTFHAQAAKHNDVCPPPWICKLDRSVDAGTCSSRFGSKYQLQKHIKAVHQNYRVRSLGTTTCDRIARMYRIICLLSAHQLVEEAAASSATLSAVPGDVGSRGNGPQSGKEQSRSVLVEQALSGDDRSIDHDHALLLGLIDLAQNGGLKLYVDAMTILNRIEDESNQRQQRGAPPFFEPKPI